MTDAAADTPAKKPGPRLSLTLGMIALGTVLGVLGLVMGIVSTVHNVRVVASGEAPTSQRVHLGAGEWQLYTDNSGSDVSGPVSVTDSSGMGVVTYGLGATSEFRSYRGDDYDAEVRFTIHHSGEYTINTTAAGNFDYIVTRTYGGAVRAAVGWFVVLGVGFVIGFFGLVLLIVGVARRRSARKLPFVAGAGYAYAGGSPGGYGYPGGYATPAPPAPGQPAQPPMAAQPTPLPAAGWYADPQIPGTSRWWDGTRWTDHTQASDQH